MLSLAMEDRLLMAMLGEYMLPLYILVRRLEKPPIDPRPLPLPRFIPCWLGRRFRGMNMKERSTEGKMYLGGRLGREIRTGLSRLRGGL